LSSCAELLAQRPAEAGSEGLPQNRKVAAISMSVDAFARRMRRCESDEYGNRSTTCASKKLSPEEVRNRLFLGRSGEKGSHVVEIRVRNDLPIQAGKNPNELIHVGTMRDGRQGEFTVKPNAF
jgi:hypothetical protein